METHLTEADLERFLDGETGFLEKIRFRRHLQACEQCRNLKSILHSSKEFLRDFRNGISRLEEAEEKAKNICINPDKKTEEQ